MSVVGVLGLAALALVDSTSIGTLVLPLVLLLAPRVHVGRYLVYLGTVAGFYALVGIGLVAGAGTLDGLLGEVGEVEAVRWAQLVVGVVLFAVGAFGDPRRWLDRLPGRQPRPRETGSSTRSARWRERIQGPDASYRVVAVTGLGAALVEVASMLPFLAAIGIITAADLPVVGWVPVVLAYTVVMVLPALVLLAARLAFDARLRSPLARLSAWLDRHTGNALYWVLAIVGFLLVQDAAGALFTGGPDGLRIGT